MRGILHVYLWDDFFVCVIWYVRHDMFICGMTSVYAEWLPYMQNDFIICGMTSLYAEWLPYMRNDFLICGMTSLYVGHDTREIHDEYVGHICVTHMWICGLHMCHTYVNMWVTYVSHICEYVWHICVTHIHHVSPAYHVPHMWICVTHVSHICEYVWHICVTHMWICVLRPRLVDMRRTHVVTCVSWHTCECMHRLIDITYIHIMCLFRMCVMTHMYIICLFHMCVITGEMTWWVSLCMHRHVCHDTGIRRSLITYR